jgi:hypothetical protein
MMMLDVGQAHFGVGDVYTAVIHNSDAEAATGQICGSCIAGVAAGAHEGTGGRRGTSSRKASNVMWAAAASILRDFPYFHWPRT